MSQYAISSKWLPKYFIQIFKEYLRTKLQVPVVRVNSGLTSTSNGHTVTGPRFKVSSKRPEKRGISLGLVDRKLVEAPQ